MGEEGEEKKLRNFPSFLLHAQMTSEIEPIKSRFVLYLPSNLVFIRPGHPSPFWSSPVRSLIVFGFFVLFLASVMDSLARATQEKCEYPLIPLRMTCTKIREEFNIFFHSGTGLEGAGNFHWKIFTLTLTIFCSSSVIWRSIQFFSSKPARKKSQSWSLVTLFSASIIKRI